MEKTLGDICAVAGVSGCFVCDSAGRIRASAPLHKFDTQVLEAVGRTISQTIAGLFVSRRRKIHEIDLLYSGGRVVVKPVAEGYLCVICARTMNVPLLNLTANVAARKLAEAMRSEAPLPEPTAPEGTVVDDMVQKIVDAYPDIVGLILELDQTLTSETREEVLAALGEEVGAEVFRARHANMRVPSSISQGLQLAIVPSVNLFALAKAQGNRLDVPACPFCRNLRSPSPRCHFLAGFVQGMLNSIPGLEAVWVHETLCRAKGDDTCTFVAWA